ncbi:MAG: tRNA (uridine(54)-C5)-methyltransferase TrmA [Deltaproteobacteria bacterium]|nr:tRNA (uridine(54)-C5)-methyltransferase TrmA [Deltaproteobacteria bacterium]
MNESSQTPEDAQLANKVARLGEQFRPLEPPPLEVFPSPATHHRMRAEFRVWHDGDDLYYIMFDRGTKEHYRVDAFPSASRLINAAMPALMDRVRVDQELRRRLFQVDFLSTLSGELLITLLYHRKLDEAWMTAASALRTTLRAEGLPVDLLGRARKTKLAMERDYVVEQLQVGERSLTYMQVENSFTQPNARMAQHMLAWTVDCTRDSTGDLLELYCGNGHFSIALAPNFRRVLATELSKGSVRAAHHNIAANGVDNMKIVRLSAAEVTEAIRGTRPFRRLRHANVNLETYDFGTVLVDPPRAGMDEDTCEMVRQFDRIVYISCNPDTLRQNLEQLHSTHQVMRFALFDQFPNTTHIESGVLLQRR